METGISLPIGQPRPWLRPKNLLFGFIGLMFVYVLATRETFLINPNDPFWKHFASFKWWLLPHGVAGACALLIAPMQFSERLRQRYLRLHRILGGVYIAGAFIAAPLGAYIQYLNEPLGSSRSFTVEAVTNASLWVLATGIALACIRKGKVQQHRRWMVRSFAVGPFVFIEGRVILGVFHLGKPGASAAEIVVWACMASSIFLADVVLQVEELLRSRPIAAKAQVARRARESLGECGTSHLSP